MLKSNRTSCAQIAVSCTLRTRLHACKPISGLVRVQCKQLWRDKFFYSIAVCAGPSPFRPFSQTVPSTHWCWSPALQYKSNRVQMRGQQGVRTFVFSQFMQTVFSTAHLAGMQDRIAASNTTATKRAAKHVVEEFYARYNKGDVDGIMDLFAEHCEYHDMIYADPFTGREEIRAFFSKFSSALSSDLQFVVDGITGGDPHNTGVKWHLELNGVEFPYSRGLSFYEVNDEGKITSARDIPEPTIKPGDSAIYAIKALTPLVRKLGPKANPANIKIPRAAAAAWALYIGYISVVLFSSWLPGQPAYAVEWRTLVETWHCSINFFYVNQVLNWVGVHLIESVPEHPVNEALFNLVNVWSLMLWPLMLADKKGAKVKNKFGIYLGTQFLTNIFFMPYLALREQPAGSRGTAADADPKKAKLPSYAPLIGITGAVVGVASVIWAVGVRPEYGGLADRWQYFVQQSFTNRVFFAFVLDAVLYSIWQALLMDEDATKLQRFLPFGGLVAYLLKGGNKQKSI